MQIQDLGVTGAIGIIILALAVIGFLKGLIRTVLALVCLGIAGYATFWGHEHASDFTGGWLDSPGLWLPKIIAVTTGLIVFFICRYLLHFLIDPFNRSKTGKRIGFGLPAAALSLCSGLLILWLSFTGIRYAGSVAELRHLQHQLIETPAQADDIPAYTLPFLLKAKQAIDASAAGKWHRLTDPAYIPGDVRLCQILILYHHSQSRLEMLRVPKFNALLNHPQFIELAYASDIKEQAATGSPKALLSAPATRLCLASREISTMLDNISMADISAIANQTN